ncbi:MAG: 3-phosphoshikimate 1-carboxyvinyltransferase [Acidobacteria bacterium]|nr:3-phosphoshikimate 1-carboxyvinyltransferase [Acidobacteriota bacterium]
MNREIRPARVEGCVIAPPSKSMTQRAVAAAMLARGTSTILTPSLCEDAHAAFQAARALGAHVDLDTGQVRVEGGGAAPDGSLIDCGESGLCMRMFTPIAALFAGESTLTARGSLASRPVGMVEAPLKALGAACTTANGLPPIVVRGPLRGGTAQVDGSTSSQLLTGLLIAAPACGNDTTLVVSELKSHPYVRMTIDVLADFGVRVVHDESLTQFHIRGGQRYGAREYQVEGDWSGAAFLLVAGALAGRARVSNLRGDSRQADRAILDVLRACGAGVRCECDAIDVSGRVLAPFAFDASDCPDLFPPLVALASACTGTSRLSGAGRLRHKESDRAASLSDVFRRLGGTIAVTGDVMEVTGGTLAGGTVDPRGDHRIAMAAAVAGLVSRDGVLLQSSECVRKSYPGFFEDLESLRRG